MNWHDFLEKYRAGLGSPYEIKFVEHVLSRVPDLDFALVRAQTPFEDAAGRKRRIDFTISQGEHVRIALEVDGWDKRNRGAGMTRAEFDDWSRREIAMGSQGWKVLRFANGLVDRSPRSCARHIDLVLRQARALELSQEETREFETLEHERAKAMRELEVTVRESLREVRGMKTVAISFAVSIVVIVLGVLGAIQLLDRESNAVAETFCEGGIDWSRAGQFIGQIRTVKGPVVSAVHAKTTRNTPTFLNVGADHEVKERFTVVIWGEHRAKFGEALEEQYRHKTLCVKGKITDYNGVPRITLSSPAQISVQ